jgi:hypothetical protein
MEVTGLRRPHSVCLDRKGCMYVTDLAGIVTKFDSDGKLAKRCVCVCVCICVCVCVCVCVQEGMHVSHKSCWDRH